MPTISFGADTQDELIEMVRRWVAGLTVEVPVAAEAAEEKRVRDVSEVMRQVKGGISRELVLVIARAARGGRSVSLDELRSVAGKTTGTEIAGALGGPNKLARRIAHRPLITREGRAGDYSIDPRDAEIILAVAG